jgi:hypothetical protein
LDQEKNPNELKLDQKHNRRRKKEKKVCVPVGFGDFDDESTLRNDCLKQGCVCEGGEGGNFH